MGFEGGFAALKPPFFPLQRGREASRIDGLDRHNSWVKFS
jgi:hypothetical protein